MTIKGLPDAVSIPIEEGRQLRSSTKQATTQSEVAAAKGEPNPVVLKQGFVEKIKSAFSSLASYFTSKPNVISFNEDLKGKFESIGFKLNARNITIIDKGITEIDSEDDEDYSPDSPTEVEFDGEVAPAELDALKTDASQPVANPKVTTIIKTVAVVAAVAFSIYIGAKYFADTSALKACIANNSAIEKACNSSKTDLISSNLVTIEQVQDKAKKACDALLDTTRKEGYVKAEGDYNATLAVANTMMERMDAGLLTCKTAKGVVKQLSKIFMDAINGAQKDLCSKGEISNCKV